MNRNLIILLLEKLIKEYIGTTLKLYSLGMISKSYLSP